MLVVGFFLQTIFDFLLSDFEIFFKNHSRFFVALSLNLKRYSTVIVFVKLWGFQDSSFCQLGHLMRDIIRAIDA